jgi:hypothetical protein
MVWGGLVRGGQAAQRVVGDNEGIEVVVLRGAEAVEIGDEKQECRGNNKPGA